MDGDRLLGFSFPPVKVGGPYVAVLEIEFSSPSINPVRFEAYLKIKKEKRNV